MKKVLILALAPMMALAGCNTAGVQTDLSSAVAAVDANVTAARTTLGKISKNVSGACATIKVAEGYFNDVALFVPASAQNAEAIAAGIVDGICGAAASTTLPSVLTQLGQAWAVIQAAAHKPGT